MTVFGQAMGSLGVASRRLKAGRRTACRIRAADDDVQPFRPATQNGAAGCRAADDGYKDPTKGC